ncbi:MAG: prolyl oligopeptidase family serine peptidase [Holosporaceae bacterium]|jgi:dipeptidyl aminopeptidase/acylaminoacyl peptidase|nr:prolyl oligopeptidase family serine peptidase [Holosporaceae bacterium]
MFQKIIAFCWVAIAILIGCDRVSQEDEHSLIPRSVLQSNPEKFGVLLNHAGDKIAYFARKGHEVELRVEDLFGNVIRKFDIKPSHFVWTRTGEHILIEQDKDGDENYHIICLDIKTGTSKDLTPFEGARSHIGGISKKYPQEAIIISNKNDPKWYDAYRMDIITGKADLVFRNIGKYADFVFDNNLNLRLASKLLPSGDIEYYSMGNGEARLFKKIPFEDSRFTVFTHFRADNNVVYALTSLNRDKRALVAYDLRNNSEKILFKSDLADVEELNCDPNNFIPQYAVVDYLKPEIFVIDKAVSKDIAYLQRHANGRNLRIVSRNDQDDTWLMNYYSSDCCRKHYLYRRNAKTGEPISLKFLFSAQPTLDKYKLQKKEPFVIKSRDGQNLVCYLTKSTDFKAPTPRKLIVYVHGGPWGRDDDYCDPDVQLLANRGYSVLQINYRGSTGFGKKFINIADGNLDKIRNDIIDGVNWAIANKIADKNHVAIMGGSFGGYSVLAGLAFNPDVFCCGVDVVGPANLLTFIEAIPPYWICELDMLSKFFGDPRTKEGREFLLKNSPITYVQDISKPLLVFHGKNDPRVKQKEADQIVGVLKEKRSPVAYVLYPDEGHGFHREQNAKSYMAFTEIFLAKILGGRFEPIYPGELDGSSHQILEGKEILGL